jgi:cation:H+ antiporter
MDFNRDFIWIQFLLCVAIIFYAGMKLSFLGDVISEKLKVGKTWVGVTFLAIATSLPELVTSSSAAKIGAADIAIGNLLGSNLFNLLIIAMISIITIKRFKKINPSKTHIISGAMGIMLMAITALSLIFHTLTQSKSILNEEHFLIGIDSFVIIIVFFVGMRFLFRREKELVSIASVLEKKIYGHLSIAKTFGLFALFTLFILASGIRMAQLGEIISQQKIHFLSKDIIIGQTLVGIILVAIATSLPELVVSLGALKIKEYNMAIGNALGSNMFNILIIPIADLFYNRGPILLLSSSSHIFTALLGIIITSIVILAIYYRLEARAPRKIAFDGWIIIAIYIIGLYLMLKANLIIQ